LMLQALCAYYGDFNFDLADEEAEGESTPQ